MADLSPVPGRALSAGPAPGILPLRLEGVSVQVDGRKLLADLSLEIGAGPRTVILGPNGAGKSLLLRICHGLLAPSAGQVRWCGPLAGEARRRQALVFQRPVLLRRSAAANVAYALRLRHVPAPERVRRVAEALDLVGLGALGDRAARALSGGEQQRLALARAWALRPDVLFLDEPTASLDPAATRGIEDAIRAVHARGTTIVMTTHDLYQARRLAERVLFLHRGRLLEAAPAERFFTAPATPEARAFIQGELLA